MEAVCTSETSVNFNVATRWYIPKDSKLNHWSWSQMCLRFLSLYGPCDWFSLLTHSYSFMQLHMQQNWKDIPFGVHWCSIGAGALCGTSYRSLLHWFQLKYFCILAHSCINFIPGPPPLPPSHAGWSTHIAVVTLPSSLLVSNYFTFFVLQKCVDKDPARRWSCEQLFRHPYFDNFHFKIPDSELEEFEKLRRLRDRSRVSR
jgi:serine/threonine protein kinase